MKKTIRLSLAGMALFAAGCVDQEPLFPSPSTSARTDAAITVEGETGPGAQYALHVPERWNGDLVLYAHGIRDASTPVDLRDQDGYQAIRDQLLAQGYAFGYSSYSENGLAIQDGGQRTHQLSGIFTSKFARPERVFLMGHSLGGVVAVKLAEAYPQQYAGALAMCAQLGGTQATADYMGHVRVLFDYFYPDVLPGDAMNIPEGVDPMTQVIQPASLAMGSNPAAVGAILAIMAAQGMPVPGATPAQFAESIITALVFGVRALPDLLDRTHGHIPFDNTTTVYGSAALPAALVSHLNATVDRFAATPDAVNYLQRYYQPSGRLQVPVLTLSNVFDPISTPFHEPTYAATVAAAGTSSLLSQRRAATPYGHCRITPTEAVSAFSALVGWAESGLRPVS